MRRSESKLGKVRRKPNSKQKCNVLRYVREAFFGYFCLITYMKVTDKAFVGRLKLSR